MIHCMRPLQARGAITAIVTMNSLMMSVLWRERGPLAQWTTTTELSAMLSWRATLGRGSAWMYLIGVGILQSSTLWRIALVLSRKNASTRFLPDQGGPSALFFFVTALSAIEQFCGHGSTICRWAIPRRTGFDPCIHFFIRPFAAPAKRVAIPTTTTGHNDGSQNTCEAPRFSSLYDPRFL